MSWQATAWAKRRMTGGVGTKAVLMILAEHCDARGISWPSIKLIAEESEISERSVKRHIRALAEAGLIEIRPRKQENGWQATNMYVLPFDRAEITLEYDAGDTIECDEPDRQPGDKLAPGPGDRGGQNRVTNWPPDAANRVTPEVKPGATGVTPRTDHRTNITPKPPLDETDGPQDEPVIGSKPDGTGKPASAFDQAFARWPGNETDDRDRALKAWNGLEPTDRSNASQHINRHIADWAAQKRGRRHWTFAKYLTERPWQRVKPDRTIAVTWFKPWTVDWILYRLDLLLAGPGVLDPRDRDHWRDLYRFDHRSRGDLWPARPKDWQRPAIEMKWLALDSVELAEWKAVFDALKWPWFDLPWSLGGLHLPACGPPDPDDMDEFVARFRRRGGEADDDGEIEAAAE